eukprot:scaffold2636_cov340-Pavlova_lutheri.AAC.84
MARNASPFSPVHDQPSDPFGMDPFTLCRAFPFFCSVHLFLSEEMVHGMSTHPPSPARTTWKNTAVDAPCPSSNPQPFPTTSLEDSNPEPPSILAPWTPFPRRTRPAAGVTCFGRCRARVFQIFSTPKALNGHWRRKYLPGMGNMTPLCNARPQEVLGRRGRGGTGVFRGWGRTSDAFHEGNRIPSREGNGHGPGTNPNPVMDAGR